MATKMLGTGTESEYDAWAKRVSRESRYAIDGDVANSACAKEVTAIV